MADSEVENAQRLKIRSSFIGKNDVSNLINLFLVEFNPNSRIVLMIIKRSNTVRKWCSVYSRLFAAQTTKINANTTCSTSKLRIRLNLVAFSYLNAKFRLIRQLYRRNGNGEERLRKIIGEKDCLLGEASPQFICSELILKWARYRSVMSHANAFQLRPSF